MRSLIQVRKAWPEMVILLITVAILAAWENGSLTSGPLDHAPRPADSIQASGVPWPPSGLPGPRLGGRGFLPDLRGAWDEGVRKADEHLREGLPYFRTYGQVPDVAPAIDVETGIPLQAQAEAADERGKAFDEGYRARVLQYIGVRGLPRVSRKPWLQDILLADRYFARSGSPVPFARGGRVTSPDGMVSVERGQGQEEVVTVRSGESRWAYPFSYDDGGSTVALLWGPAGSRTVFLRYFDGTATAYFVLATDMKWRVSLNVVVPWQSPQTASPASPRRDP